MERRTTRRAYLRTAAVTAGVAGMAGCLGGGGGDGGDSGDGGDGGDGGSSVVDMNDQLQFDPETIEVSVGTTVTWENVGSIGHSVTAYEDSIPDGADYWASGGFDSEQAARDAYSVGDPDSGDVPGGETYEHTFETAGTHEYFCIPHEASGMKGEVVVG